MHRGETRFKLLGLLVGHALLSRVVSASAQNYCSSLASMDAGKSLLQARFQHATRGPEGEQNCSWKSPSLPLQILPLAIRHDLTFENYTDNNDQGLFVHPPKKFGFCLIEKNACSTWIKDVMQPLLTGSVANLTAGCEVEDKESCLQAIRYNISHRSQEIFGREGIESIFQDPTATRAVFVRDPLERFASAFLDRCFGMRENCPIQSSKFRDAVEWALANDMSEQHPYWSPQADHCELKHRILGYNVIVLMTTETFEEDKNCLLAKAGLHEFIKRNQTRINPSMGTWNTSLVLQKLFPPQVARQLIKHMHLDYEVLSLPREPEWLTGATGEWYDLDPAPQPPSLTVGVQQKDTTDDIVELAIRAGYAS